MNKQNSSDFLHYCGNDINKLIDETDPLKKVHLLRNINLQMYAEARNSGYSEFACTRILDDDLPEYVERATPVYQKMLEKTLTDLKLDIKPSTTFKPMANFDAIKHVKQCNESSKYKKVKQCVEKVLKEIQQIETIHENSTAANTRVIASTSNEKGKDEDDDDDEGDCIEFDLKFRQTKNFVKNDVKSCPSPSTNQRMELNTSEMKTNIADFHKERTKPSMFVNTYKSFTSVKRKSVDEPINENEKRSAFQIPTVKEEPIEDEPPAKKFDFKTGTEELQIQHQKKYGQNSNNLCSAPNSGISRKTLGNRRNIYSKFVSPLQNTDTNTITTNTINQSTTSSSNTITSNANNGNEENADPRLKNIEPKMIEMISNEIMSNFSPIDWNSIAGLEYAKTIIKEAVVFPILRPDIFTGLRRPPRGILLFGPPGTGKTLIGKCIASQSKSTFFSISASSLTSKWIGEGEKMVRALFAVASIHQPAVIFIDEVDSLLCQRSENEHESSRRLKTEFLVQLDGAATCESERILIVGATNRPQELDEAARRRFVRRLYIPLPDANARKTILFNLLEKEKTNISNKEIDELARLTHGYSGADMKVLCQEASMGPIRCIPSSQIDIVSADTVRPLSYEDFKSALRCVRASVSQNDLQQYIDWDNTYGSGGAK